MNIFDPFKSHSVEETRQWGKALAEMLIPGSLVCLAGNLGAGKTQLVKAVCEILRVPAENVTSPTFTLINEYEGRYRIIHMDMYRLEKDKEFEMLDIDYFLSQNAVILIEWADKIRHLLPKPFLYIEIVTQDETTRLFTCKMMTPHQRNIT